MRYIRDAEQPATLLQSLQERYSNTDLQHLVRQLRPGKPPTRKDEMIASLMQILEGDNLRAYLAKLDDTQRAALAEAAWSKEGAFDRERFKSQYGRLPAPAAAIDPDKVITPRSQYSTVPRGGLLDVLMPAGIMPRDVQARLRSMLSKPAKATLQFSDTLPDHIDVPGSEYDPKTHQTREVTDAIPLVRRDTERAALHDVLAVLRLADAGKLAVSDKNRWPTPGAMRAVADVLAGGDLYPEEQQGKATEKRYEPEETIPPIHGFAWPMLLQAAKLVQVSANRLALNKEGRAALTAPPHETLQVLWDRWMANDLLDELRRINVIRGQTGKGHRYLTDPAARRFVIADALTESPVGKWFTLDEFSRYMRAADHRFAVTEHDWSLYIYDQQYGSLGYEGYGGWNILQFRYILCLLMEYASALGIIDIAYTLPDGARPDYGNMWGADDLSYFSRYDGLYYMRLTPLGAWVLGITESYAPPPVETRKVLRVLPNLDVVATGPLSPADRMLIDAFAEKTADKVWRLDRERILAAIAEGRTLGELSSFLTSASGEAPPQPVAQFLDDLAKRSAALTDLGRARLVRCADATLAVLIANDSAAGKACHLVPPDMLAVPKSAESAFRRAVRKMGYTLPEHPQDA